MSKGRQFGVILVALITVAVIAMVLVGMFNETLLSEFGNKFAGAVRTFDQSFPDTADTDLAYGKILNWGYLALVPLGLLLISCLCKPQKPRLGNLFLTLFIVLSLAADVVFFIFSRQYFEIINEIDLPGEVYKLMGFIPIPNLFAENLVMFSRVSMFRVFPLLAQILLVLPYALLRKFRPKLYEFINFMVYLLLVAFMPVLCSFIFGTAVAVFIIGVILWAIKGFFTVDTGSVIRTSDGTTLHQVDGDTYSDGNGNYYSYDGDSFHLK